MDPAVASCASLRSSAAATVNNWMLAKYDRDNPGLYSRCLVASGAKRFDFSHATS